MLAVNLPVPVHLALPMIRNFSWGQHFLQRWMDLFSLFKMFTSGSRSPAPAALLVEGQELPSLTPADESGGITRWNSNSKTTHRPLSHSLSPKPPHLAALGGLFTRNSKSTQPTLRGAQELLCPCKVVFTEAPKLRLPVVTPSTVG